MVVASEEEANAPMSSYEAAYMEKPLLLSNIPANREEWKMKATYFDVNNIDDFVKRLKFVLGGKSDDKIKRAKDRVWFYSSEAFAIRISDRIGKKYHPHPMKYE